MIQHAPNGGISQIKQGDKLTETWTFTAQRMLPKSIQMTDSHNALVFGRIFTTARAQRLRIVAKADFGG